jgi:hypothetical protein
MGLGGTIFPINARRVRKLASPDYQEYPLLQQTANPPSNFRGKMNLACV